jgi:hypothetical protein
MPIPSSKRGRPHFGYFVFDCPSDHEIEGSIITESDAIRAVIANKSLGGRLKSLKLTTAASFINSRGRAYSGVRYVHLGGHGSTSGLAFIGGSVQWSNVATKLKEFFPVLGQDEQRVLTLSCCYSEIGARSLSPLLKGHFTAIYHFKEEEVAFSMAMATWSMFYLKKRLSKPHAAIMNDTNIFMGKDFLGAVPV